MTRTICLFLIAAAAWAQPRYDLLLKGGHVIDAKNHVSAVLDVSVSGGRIAAVAANIPAGDARRTIDVSGLYVTPCSPVKCSPAPIAHPEVFGHVWQRGTACGRLPAPFAAPRHRLHRPVRRVAVP
jgi:predicted amidohydrolase